MQELKCLVIVIDVMQERKREDLINNRTLSLYDKWKNHSVGRFCWMGERLKTNDKTMGKMLKHYLKELLFSSSDLFYPFYAFDLFKKHPQ